MARTKNPLNKSHEISVYGAEKMADTQKLCRLNLAVHGAVGDIREASSYYKVPHGKFDFVMANSPFNQPEVDRDRLANEAGKELANSPIADSVWALERGRAMTQSVPHCAADDPPRGAALGRCRWLVSKRCRGVAALHLCSPMPDCLMADVHASLNSRSPTFRSDTAKRTYITTTRRITWGEMLK